MFFFVICDKIRFLPILGPFSPLLNLTVRERNELKTEATAFKKVSPRLFGSQVKIYSADSETGLPVKLQ
jgi:hypothetical protein